MFTMFVFLLLSLFHLAHGTQQDLTKHKIWMSNQHEKPEQYDHETFLRIHSLANAQQNKKVHTTHELLNEKLVRNRQEGTLSSEREVVYGRPKTQTSGNTFMTLTYPVVSSSGYITEIMPERAGAIHPGQWMYIRICTMPIAPRTGKSTASTYEELFLDKLSKSSCVISDKSRSTFLPHQTIVIKVGSRLVLLYNLLTRNLNLTSTFFPEANVRVWSLKLQNTVLIALRPPVQLDRLRVDIFLKQPHNEHSPKKLQSSLYAMNPRWEDMDWSLSYRKTYDKRPYSAVFVQAGSGDHIGMDHNNVKKTSIEPTIKLKRFYFSFTKLPKRLTLRCNKTGPFVVFDPGVSLQGTKEEDLYHHPLKPITGKLDRQTFNQEATSATKHSSDSDSSSSIILETEEPDPVLVGETMDELAIRRTEISTQSENHNIPDKIGTHLPTSDSLLVPTELISRTFIHVVRVGEVIKSVCHGLSNPSPLKLIFEQELWENLSIHSFMLPNNPFSSSIQVNLRAIKITWENVSSASSGLTLRNADQLTSIKCGHHTHGRLSRTKVKQLKPEPAVAQLHFVIVSPADYTFINDYLSQKRNKTFSSPISRRTDNIGAIMSIIKQTNEVISGVTSADKEDKAVGFWNISLSSLSAIKLAICISLVFLILFLILLAVHHFSQSGLSDSSQNVLNSFCTTPSMETVPTWFSGDQTPVHCPPPSGNRQRTNWLYHAVNRLKRRNSRTSVSRSPQSDYNISTITGSNIHSAVGNIEPKPCHLLYYYAGQQGN